jgi:hypothetical protein
MITGLDEKSSVAVQRFCILEILVDLEFQVEMAAAYLPKSYTNHLLTNIRLLTSIRKSEHIQ